MSGAEPRHLGIKSYCADLLSEIAARPAATVFSAICILLFVLQAFDTKVKINGYGIALLAMAAIPWSLPALRTAAEAIGQALVAANIKSFQIAGVRVEQIEKKLDEQRLMLDDLILYSMAFHIYDKLKFLHLGVVHPDSMYREYKYVNDEPFNHDLRYLRDHGYLEHFQISELTVGQNLVGKLRVTEMGQRFVNLKEGRLRSDIPGIKPG
jgi:hypothetical protein